MNLYAVGCSNVSNLSFTTNVMQDVLGAVSAPRTVMASERRNSEVALYQQDLVRNLNLDRAAHLGNQSSMGSDLRVSHNCRLQAHVKRADLFFAVGLWKESRLVLYQS